MVRFNLIIIILFLSSNALAEELSLWNEGSTKTAILEYLEAIADPQGKDFIPVPDRVAVLDNDGTFWCERPRYPTNLFQIHLLKSLVAKGEVDGSRMPFKSFLDYDRQALNDYGYKEAWDEMNLVFAGMTCSSFRDSARVFMENSRHPDFGVAYHDLYYPPMLELARLLESFDFDVWVVTGSEQDFMRSFIKIATGIPDTRVIGSYTLGKTIEKDGKVSVVRGEIELSNGYAVKPANIEARIGRRPVFAAGNSDNDEPMCRFTVSGDYRSLAIWVHHDDPVREYEYHKGTDRIAALVKEYSSAHEISIKRDWVKVFGDGIDR